MKDFFGYELKLHDTVAMVCSRKIVTGEVIEFTKKMVRVRYRRLQDMCNSYILVYPEKLIVKH